MAGEWRIASCRTRRTGGYLGAAPAAPRLGIECRWCNDPIAAGSLIARKRYANRIGALVSFAGAVRRCDQWLPRSEQALLVITAGTATTIDALDAGGRFLGGMILPGLGTMAQSLALSTAQLPHVEARLSVSCFADNTLDAIVSGCVQAQLGAIMQARAQVPEASCVLSGGAAEYLLPYLPAPVQQVEQLVLRGLHVAALSES
jgi:hypothetical protein